MEPAVSILPLHFVSLPPPWGRCPNGADEGEPPFVRITLERNHIVMNPADLVVLLVVAALVAGAVILAVRQRRKGSSCCGSCAACGLCRSDEEKEQKKKRPSEPRRD